MDIDVARKLQGNLGRRLQEGVVAEDSIVQPTIIHGFAAIKGVGEATATITFPIFYAEKPVMTYGHELAANQWPVAGSFPTCSVTVFTWGTVVRPDGQTYYTSATIGIVISGPVAMMSSLHYTFTGRAFRNPVVGATGTMETL